MAKYLTPDQLTELVPGTTKGYWAQLRFLGSGPAYLKPSAKKVLYREESVISWLDASERIGTAVAA